AKLSSRTDTPLAAGSRFNSPAQFVRLIETGAMVILRPDIFCLGGLTPLLKVAALAELHRRPVVPHLLPEVGIHLACGLPRVQPGEYVRWLSPLLPNPPSLVDGELRPPDRPGLGLELNPEAVTKYQVSG